MTLAKGAPLRDLAQLPPPWQLDLFVGEAATCPKSPRPLCDAVACWLKLGVPKPFWGNEHFNAYHGAIMEVVWMTRGSKQVRLVDFHNLMYDYWTNDRTITESMVRINSSIDNMTIDRINSEIILISRSY